MSATVSEQQEAEFVEAILSGLKVKLCTGYGVKWCGRQFVEYVEDGPFGIGNLCPDCALPRCQELIKRYEQENPPSNHYLSMADRVRSWQKWVAGTYKRKYAHLHKCTVCDKVHL